MDRLPNTPNIGIGVWFIIYKTIPVATTCWSAVPWNTPVGDSGARAVVLFEQVIRLDTIQSYDGAALLG